MKTIGLFTLLLGAFALSAVAEQKISDAQIAAIVVAANQVDIDAGKFAAKKSTNSEVQKFAQTMVTDHTAVNKSAVDLVTKLKVSPQENETSRALKAGGGR
jgi:putative membrane protein